MAGHTDPAALVQMVQKGCKRLPPLAVILGEVSEVEPSEVRLASGPCFSLAAPLPWAAFCCSLIPYYKLSNLKLGD
jgi:hypothetical protein